MTEAVECQPSYYKALSSNTGTVPPPPKKETKLEITTEWRALGGIHLCCFCTTYMVPFASYQLQVYLCPYLPLLLDCVK
jgi:hypothetical protein